MAMFEIKKAIYGFIGLLIIYTVIGWIVYSQTPDIYLIEENKNVTLYNKGFGGIDSNFAGSVSIDVYNNAPYSFPWLTPRYLIRANVDNSNVSCKYDEASIINCGKLNNDLQNIGSGTSKRLTIKLGLQKPENFNITVITTMSFLLNHEKSQKYTCLSFRRDYGTVIELFCQREEFVQLSKN